MNFLALMKRVLADDKKSFRKHVEKVTVGYYSRPAYVVIQNFQGRTYTMGTGLANKGNYMQNVTQTNDNNSFVVFHT